MSKHFEAIFTKGKLRLAKVIKSQIDRYFQNIENVMFYHLEVLPSSLCLWRGPRLGWREETRTGQP